MSDARGGETGLKVLEKTYLSPQLSRKWQSSLFLKILTDVDVTICSGKQFQLSHALLEKANFTIYKLNLLLYNFNEWPLLLSNAKVKNLSLFTRSMLFNILKT